MSAFAGAVAAWVGTGDDALARVMETLAGDFDAGRAELWMWDETPGSCYLTHAAGIQAAHHLDYAPADSGAIGKIAYNRQAVENASLASFGGDDQDFARHSGLSRISGYPLLAGDKMTGVLAMYTDAEIPEETLSWWRLFAGMIAAKLAQILIGQEKDKQISQLSALFEATRLLNSTLDLVQLLELILRIARTEAKADRATVFLMDLRRNELWSIVASGLDHQEIRVPLGKGVAGRVATTGETVNAEDAYALEDFNPSFDQKFHYRTQ